MENANIQNDITLLSVTRNNLSKYYWSDYLRSKGYFICPKAKTMMMMLETPNRIPCRETRIAIIKRTAIGDNNINDFYTKAKDMNLIISNIEVAFLLRDQFSDETFKKLGLLNIIIMPVMPIEPNIRFITIQQGNIGILSNNPDEGLPSDTAFAVLQE